MKDPQLDYAVARLTQPWTDVIAPREAGDKYATIEYDPLIDMLQQAVRSSLGRTTSGPGSSGDRSPIDLKSFETLERIDGIARAWASEFQLSTKEPLKDTVTQVAAKMEALWASNAVTEVVYVGVQRNLITWVDDIWALFNPPTRKELTAPCPRCEQRYFFTTDGERQAALIAQYWHGLAPEAECQRCGARWLGEKELLELGYSIRANVNEDELRTMGVM